MGTRTVYLRSSLARSVYQRLLTDQHLRSLDKSKWYDCDLSSAPDEVRNVFIQSCSDEATEVFLQMSFDKSDWLFTQIFHAFAKALLCWFMTKTSVNGLLGRGSMFVFSESQFGALLDGYLLGNSKRKLLDIGAGDGKVTDIMATNFDEIYVTEISGVMRKILNSKGYHLLEVDNWWERSRNSGYFDAISCLNVLDRCDKPLTMLNQIHNSLNPESGILILALVLPFHQYVENSGNNEASEKITVEGSSFVEQVISLATNFFPQNGFQVIRWTRLPYLCEGDLGQSFYWLDDVVFVLKPFSQNSGQSC